MILIKLGKVSVVVCKPSLPSAPRAAVTWNVLRFLRLCPRSTLICHSAFSSRFLSSEAKTATSGQFLLALFFRNRSRAF